MEIEKQTTKDILDFATDSYLDDNPDELKVIWCRLDDIIKMVEKIYLKYIKEAKQSIKSDLEEMRDALIPKTMEKQGEKHD